jgi:glycosyltransferase involved in cell wall biosynthesis
MTLESAVELPYVTIVMPVRNEAAHIRRSLGAVIAQDYPTECLEVIVVDGCSTDDTRQVVGQFQKHFPSLRLIENPDRIVSTGLNLALKHAQGEIIVRVDGHCEIAPDYVRRCVAYLHEAGIDGVGGPVETIGKGRLAQSIAIAMSTPFGVGDSAFRTSKKRTLLVDTIPFPAYTRSAIARAGSFDEELVRNQDDEYNYRLRKLGYQLLLAADLQSRYYSRDNLKSLWTQYFQYGYWKVRVFQKHPRQMRPRQFIPPVFAAGLIGSAALALFAPVGTFFLVLIFGIYMLANLAASTLTAARRGWRHLILLPVIYTLLHFSYGLGFLVGLLRFARRWGDRYGGGSIGKDTKTQIEPTVPNC